MRKLIAHRALHWTFLLFGVVTLLPPGAWVLCLGSGGHVAIEASSRTCSDERSSDEGRSACGMDMHDSCVDYLLLSGQPATTIAKLTCAPRLVTLLLCDVPASAALLHLPPSLETVPHTPPPTSAPSLRC
jgi:hypothetical protein